MLTNEFIARLEDLDNGARSLLRELAGRPLDATLRGFDLFTCLWWPLRARSRFAPRRETSWLVAKLFCSFTIPHVRPPSGVGPGLGAALGSCEPRDQYEGSRFRTRFDALLCSDFSTIEPHLRWALREIDRAVAGRIPHSRAIQGLDWVRLLDDLSIWDRGRQHRGGYDVREKWAEDYWDNVHRANRGGTNHADRDPHDPEPQSSESQ